MINMMWANRSPEEMRSKNDGVVKNAYLFITAANRNKPAWQPAPQIEIWRRADMGIIWLRLWCRKFCFLSFRRTLYGKTHCRSLPGGLTFLFRQESKQRSRPGEALPKIFRYVSCFSTAPLDFKAALPRTLSRRCASVECVGVCVTTGS